MAVIRTVLGDISPDDAGITLTHEHIRYAYAGCEYDHRSTWDFQTVANDIAHVLRGGLSDYSIRTVVDLTPAELGRHPALIAEVARRSGVHMVATTGFYGESNGMGIPFYWRRKSIEYLEEMMVRDLTEGMVYDASPTATRAGIIKVATGVLGAKPTPIGPNGRRIGIYEDRAIRAAARAQREIGCAINTHTHPVDYSVTNPGIELLDILEEEGADPGKVVIGHPFINGTIEQLKAICERGASLQVDHIGIPWHHDSAEKLDELMAELICALTDLGNLDRLVFSYDRFFNHGRGPVTEEDPEQFNTLVSFGYLFEQFAPRLEKKGFGKAELTRVLVDNPRRLLSF